MGGITVNNSPTVSDLWNSTSVWSFPYVGSELAPTPGSAPIIYDRIAETVLGPTLYATIHDQIYLEERRSQTLSESIMR